ncbi:MAG TPA: hypothetical protein VHX68_12660 [Planctomycetaceae bacterium]|jgi:hypothetical protein|nr:hypothetical protein [Planctomycetaceae bacterium]
MDIHHGKPQRMSPRHRQWRSPAIERLVQPALMVRLAKNDMLWVALDLG